MSSVLEGIPSLLPVNVAQPFVQAHGQAKQQGQQQDSLDFDKATKVSAIVSRAAQLADSPEKWATMLGVFQKNFPSADLSAFQDFGARDALLAQLRDPYKDAELDIQKQQLAISRSNAAKGDKVTPYTDLGKAGADLKAGLITQDQFNQIAGGGGTGDLFDGKSVDGQGLNYLIRTGALTKEQAAQVAAGKTVTGADGRIIFVTPQGIFQKPQDGPPAPVDPQAGTMPGGPPQQNSGLIPLTAPNPTADQRTASTYANRATTSGAVIDKLGSAGTDWYGTAAGRIPFVGNGVQGAKFPNNQQLEQAERDFANAVLRRESGAVISDQEFESAKQQYFPQPGDTEATLKQKAVSRANAVRGLQGSAGPAYTPAPTARPASPAPAAAPPSGAPVDWQTYFGTGR